jgi:hypothetical protein
MKKIDLIWKCVKCWKTLIFPVFKPHGSQIYHLPNERRTQISSISYSFRRAHSCSSRPRAPPSMESGEPRPSASGWASPPPPNPPSPPPKGWLAGLVSGAGRILASVLGPEPSGCGTGSTSSAAASDGGSPLSSCSLASSRPREEDHNDGAGTRFLEFCFEAEGAYS